MRNAGSEIARSQQPVADQRGADQNGAGDELARTATFLRGAAAGPR